jgi:DNA-directed RNA polymerase subunit M/transcription elongation factor TFIIS
MRRDFKVEKLNDEFGQYDLVLSCTACGHTRKASPHTFAKLCGWEAALVDVAKRMRCPKCGQRKCSLKPLPLITPRGYKSH